MRNFHAKLHIIFKNTNFLVNFTRFPIFDYKEFKRQAWWRTCIRSPKKIEVLDEETPNTPNGVDSGEQTNSSYPHAKLLKGVEKSYDSGKKILDASLDADKAQARFSLPEREQKRDDEYKKAHDEMQRAKVANSYDKGIDVNYSENGKTKIMRLHTPVSDVENLKATAIKPHSMSRDDQKRLYQSFKPETNVSTGETVEFYTSAFGKNHRENGLFEKIIPQIRELFKESKLIYSETEQLSGTKRRDSTTHKRHFDIVWIWKLPK